MYDYLFALYPHRFPSTGEVLYRLLCPLLDTEIQKVHRKSTWRAECARKEGAENVGISDRRDWDELGQYLPFPIPTSTDLSTFRTMVSRRFLRWYVGFLGSKGR